MKMSVLGSNYNYSTSMVSKEEYQFHLNQVVLCDQKRFLRNTVFVFLLQVSSWKTTHKIRSSEKSLMTNTYGS